MSAYQPLTKIIKDEQGNEIVVCQLYGSIDCRILHNSQGCIQCPMMSAILNQLHLFEKIYMDETVIEEEIKS